jgi:hypothetical protein
MRTTTFRATHRAGSWTRMHTPDNLTVMPLRPGSKRRPNDSPTVLLQARVDPQIRAKANGIAAAAGVSLSAYIEQLIAHEERQLDDKGRPAWWPEAPDDEQEELELKTA